jgi:ubiquinone/menaquinone biosynthesis C-methylase UbiE
MPEVGQREVQKYLEGEGIVERSMIEVRDEIVRHESRAFFRKIGAHLLVKTQNEPGYFEYLCKSAGGMPVYDFLKSMERKYIEWALVKALETGELAPGKRVIDVGCGTGLEAVFFAECVGSKGRVVGIDKVKEMVEAAKKRAKKRGLSNTTFSVGDRDQLPAENAFDLLTCFNSLTTGESFEGSQAEARYNTTVKGRLGEFRRALKRGGKIMLTSSSSDGLVMAQRTVFKGFLGDMGFSDVEFEDAEFTDKDNSSSHYLLVSGRKL